jgi:hypothetical protein
MEKTAIQEVFSELENLHPHLFNIYSTEGREFVNYFHKFLAIEKQQIIDAFNNEINCEGDGDIYYNEKFKKVDI